mgnify:CR=1 FL=1
MITKMQKYGRLIVLFAVLLATTAHAKVVDSNAARGVAARFACLHGIDGTPVLAKTLCDETLGVPAVYFFAMSGGGYVMVAGDDCLRPVLAYSYGDAVPPAGRQADKQWPPAMQAYARSRASEATYAQNHSLQPAQSVSDQWEALVSQPKLALPPGRTADSPRKEQPDFLLTTLWDQDWPYNMYCPVIDDNTAPVGCVATAMSQIMRFWHHPEQGEGSSNYFCAECGTRLYADYGGTTYAFDLMPDELGYASNDNEKDAVATLCYHAGISVLMHYGSTTSGVNMGSVAGYVTRALKNYFKYDQSSTRSLYRSTYTDDVWVDTIRGEIEAGRPVFYCGYDDSSDGSDAGHAFVIDGYDPTTGFFHVNWGWGPGWNGWYDLYSSALYAAGYHFSSLQLAVMGIQPAIDTLPDTTDTDTIPDIDTTTNPDTLGIRDISNQWGADGGQLPVVYPNPAHSTVTIVTQPWHTGEVAVFSASGRLMWSVANNQWPATGNRWTVNVSDWQAGIYFCTAGGQACKFAVTR